MKKKADHGGWHTRTHAADADGRPMCRPIAPRHAIAFASGAIPLTCEFCKSMQRTAGQRLGYMQGRGAA